MACQQEPALAAVNQVWKSFFNLSVSESSKNVQSKSEKSSKAQKNFKVKVNNKDDQ